MRTPTESIFVSLLETDYRTMMARVIKVSGERVEGSKNDAQDSFQ